ncbi:MAG: copper chaperone PCu(A)C, partial [Lysobacterales bacterium]
MRVLPAVCIASLLAAVSPFVHARDALRASGAYILAAPPSARSNVGYMTITNLTRHPVRLLAIDSDRFARLEMHSMREENGVMQMRNLR